VGTRGLCCLLFIVDKRQRGPGSAGRQADALRREGVEIREDAMGQYTIDLAQYGWFPDVLPSESGLVESSDEEEDEEAAAYHT
jgi:methylated-DNA-protein-cysteine methyltransferase-like protein